MANALSGAYRVITGCRVGGVLQRVIAVESETVERINRTGDFGFVNLV